MRLTSQDKLALALTSYGSTRALARDLGVSHQTVGRWLREGQRDDSGRLIGTKQIPAEAAAAIDAVFSIHADIAREQARVDKLPFNKAAPVFIERKAKRDGTKGERVVAEHTQYIRPDLRVQTIKDAAKSKKFLQASVRSRVDLKRYFKERAAEKIKERGWRMKPAELARTMLDAFVKKEANEKNRIVDKAEPFSLFTQYEDVSPRRADPLEAALGIEDKLRKKHEPAIGSAGTALADAFLFQLMPKPLQNEGTEKPSRAKQARPRAQARRYIKGRGPK